MPKARGLLEGGTGQTRSLATDLRTGQCLPCLGMTGLRRALPIFRQGFQSLASRPSPEPPQLAQNRDACYNINPKPCHCSSSAELRHRW
jgi:hypothetical protein